MPAGHVNYRSWLLRVITWDTLLPACVGLIPYGIKLLFPNRRGVIELTAVTLPVAAFFLRLRAGRRQIAANHCSEAVRRFQFGIFVLGVLPLVLVDCFLILTHVMPPGALFAAPGDWLISGIVLGIYLLCMTIAMYPGYSPAEEEPDPFVSGDVFG
jgi:hypothetical protein